MFMFETTKWIMRYFECRHLLSLNAGHVSRPSKSFLLPVVSLCIVDERVKPDRFQSNQISIEFANIFRYNLFTNVIIIY